eukprot:6750894-Pyramimonas_sp.AAC.1
MQADAQRRVRELADSWLPAPFAAQRRGGSQEASSGALPLSGGGMSDQGRVLHARPCEPPWLGPR